MDNNIIDKRTETHICANCGGADGIHQFETMKCPKNGIEETRPKFQKWLGTTFEDSGLREFEIKACNEYESLVKANKELLEALKKIVNDNIFNSEFVGMDSTQKLIIKHTL